MSLSRHQWCVNFYDTFYFELMDTLQFTSDFLDDFFQAFKHIKVWSASKKKEIDRNILYTKSTDIFQMGLLQCHHQDDDRTRQTLNPNLNCCLCRLFGFYISEAYPNVRFVVLPKNQVVVTGSELIRKLETHAAPLKIWKNSGIDDEVILEHLYTHYGIAESQTPKSLSEAWIGVRIARPLYGLEKAIIQRYIACPNPTCSRTLGTDAMDKNKVVAKNAVTKLKSQLKKHAGNAKHPECTDIVNAFLKTLPGFATQKDLGAFWAGNVFNTSQDTNMRMHFEDGYEPNHLHKDQLHEPKLHEPTQTIDEDPDAFVRPYWYPLAMYDFGLSIGAVRTSPESNNAISTGNNFPPPIYYISSLLASPNLSRSPLRHDTGRMFLMQRLASVIDYTAYLHLKTASAILVAGHPLAKEQVTAR